MIILDLTFLILLVSIFAVGGLQSASGPFCSFAMFLFENNWLIFLIALALFAVVNHEYSDQECLSGSSQISFIALQSVIDLVGLIVPIVYVMIEMYPLCTGGGSFFALLYAPVICGIGTIISMPYIAFRTIVLKKVVPALERRQEKCKRPLTWGFYAAISLALLMVVNGFVLIYVLNKSNFAVYLSLFDGSQLDTFLWGQREIMVNLISLIGGTGAVDGYQQSNIGVTR